MPSILSKSQLMGMMLITAAVVIIADIILGNVFVICSFRDVPILRETMKENRCKWLTMISIIRAFRVRNKEKQIDM